MMHRLNCVILLSLLSSGSDSNIYIYNLNQKCEEKKEHQETDGFVIQPLAVIDRAVSHSSSVCKLQWYPFDTGMFTSSSIDGVLKIWDANSLESICTFNLEGKHLYHEMSKIAYSHSLIAATHEENVRLCDLRSGGSTHTLRGHKKTVSCCRWSPSEDYQLVSSSYDRTIKVWDIRKANSCLRTFQYLESNESLNESYSHMSEIFGITFTPDGLNILSVGTDLRMILWDVKKGLRLPIHFQALPSCNKRLNDITRCPVMTGYEDQGHSLLACQPLNNKYIGVYNLSNGKMVNQLSGHFEKVYSVALREGSQELYSAGKDLEILVWDSQIDENRASGSIIQNHEEDEWSD